MLVSRGAYIWEGLYSGEAYIQDCVCFIYIQNKLIIYVIIQIQNSTESDLKPALNSVKCQSLPNVW